MVSSDPPRPDAQPERIAPTHRDWTDQPPAHRSQRPNSQAPRHAWWEGNPEAIPLVHPRDVPSDILAIERFVTADQCAIIRQAFEASRASLGANPVDSFWDNRLIWFDQIAPAATAAKALMQQARFVIAYRIAEHFGTERRLYSDSQQLVLWGEGQSMPVHVDNAHPDGSRHNTPHRDFAAVLYLNDAFEGGEIYFPLQEVRVKPSTGLLVAFRGSADAPHGVTKVRKGERFTMPCWYSFDPAVAEASMFTIV